MRSYRSKTKSKMEASIAEHVQQFNIKRMCELIDLSWDCYYHWLNVDTEDDK